MSEKIYIQRLALYLKSGTNLVIDFKVDDPGTTCQQIEDLKKALDKPESEEPAEELKDKALESKKEFIEFKGQREVHVRIEEIAAFEVLSLVLTPTPKETAKAE